MASIDKNVGRKILGTARPQDCTDTEPIGQYDQTLTRMGATRQAMLRDAGIKFKARSKTSDPYEYDQEEFLAMGPAFLREYGYIPGTIKSHILDRYRREGYSREDTFGYVHLAPLL